MKNVLGKDSCYSAVAIEVGNPELCEKINARPKGDISKGESSVYDDCYEKIASASNNSEICTKIIGDNQRNSCYTVIATTIGNGAICEKITGEYANYYKPQCILLTAQKEGNIDACNTLTEGFRDNCYVRIALQSKNITL